MTTRPIPAAKAGSFDDDGATDFLAVVGGGDADTAAGAARPERFGSAVEIAGREDFGGCGGNGTRGSDTDGRLLLRRLTPNVARGARSVGEA